MLLFTAIKSNIVRAFKSPYIYISVSMLISIGWLQMVEMSNGTTDLALSVMLGTSRENCSCDALVSSLGLIFNYHSSHWYDIILIVSSAICFSITFCDERTSGMIRFSLSRCGKDIYIAAKLVSSAITSSVTVLLSFFIFALSACLFAPSVNSFPLEVIEDFLSYYDIYDKLSISAISQPLLNTFNIVLFDTYNAVFWSICAMTIASVKPNKYFAITLPAVFWYFWDKILYGNIYSYNQWQAIFDTNLYFDPFKDIFGSLGLGLFEATICVIMLMSLRVAIPSAVYYLFMKKRVDVGAET